MIYKSIAKQISGALEVAKSLISFSFTYYLINHSFNKRESKLVLKGCMVRITLARKESAEWRCYRGLLAQNT